jgi:SAM-dependent methyltransferase
MLAIYTTGTKSISDNSDFMKEWWTAFWNRFERVGEIGGLQSSWEYQRLISKHIQVGSRILEGGCGLGQWVVFLERCGYEVIGVDFSVETIRRLKIAFPHLQFHVANVRALPYPSDFFDAYLSFGVVEHFEDGPTDALLEACRVVRPGGIYVVSVPYLSLLKRIRGSVPEAWEPTKERLHFFEYAFSIREFLRIIRGCGFQVVEYHIRSVER